MGEKEKMDKENTHRQSSEPEEKNKEREVTTEREDGRKETEETNPCKEHFHPSTSGHRELLVSIRFNEPGWQWSGCFLPDHPGDTQDALELAHGHAPFSKYPPMKVLLLTLQNAPFGLDYERDKNVFKVEVEEMNPEALQPRFVKV
ncbi:unnamed protein product [Camellia sinensis]